MEKSLDILKILEQSRSEQNRGEAEVPSAESSTEDVKVKSEVKADTSESVKTKKPQKELEKKLKDQNLQLNPRGKIFSVILT